MELRSMKLVTKILKRLGVKCVGSSELYPEEIDFMLSPPQDGDCPF
jgi:hypothetical protein